MARISRMGAEDVERHLEERGFSEKELAAYRSAMSETREPDPELEALSDAALRVPLDERDARYWRIVDRGPEGGIMDNTRTGRRVILSVGREDDGEVWLHGSISRRDRQVPTYDDLTTLHRLMGGRLAYQVFAPPDEHYTVSVREPYEVLHLWAKLTGPRATPDFRHYGVI